MRSEFERVMTTEWLEYDWNERFQPIHDRNVATPRDERERTADMAELLDNYTAHTTAVSYSIVARSLYPDHEPLIDPVNVGGQAGGEKFMKGKVLYKLAREWLGIYGGNDQQATNAALLEMKAMDALIRENVRLIHTTLVNLFRYRGYCVYAIAVAPIQQLVYGSQDAGHHVADARNLPAIGGIMRQVAFGFHLRLHGVPEKSTRTIKQLYHPVDVECHIGSDRRIYMFDMARESPPTPPVRGIPHSFLVRQFRFEALKSIRQTGLPSLSSDAYSNFCDPAEHALDRRDIGAAFDHVMNVLVPLVAQRLDRDGAVENLSAIFHEHGVNMRYIPSVAKHCTVASVRRYLCEEMFIRTLKLHARDVWNKTLACSNSRLLDDLCALVDGLFGDGSGGLRWPHTLRDDLMSKYRGLDEDTGALSNELSLISTNGEHPWSMIVRLLDGLSIGYDAELPLSSSAELQAHRQTWRMVADVTPIKLPEFVELRDRERQLRHEAFCEQANLSVVGALSRLLELYRVWSEEEPAVSQAHGVEVADRLLSIVDSSPPSHDMGHVMFDLHLFFEHFGMIDRQLHACERGVELMRLLLSRADATNSSEYRAIQSGLSSFLNSLGNVCKEQGRYDDAIGYYEEAMDLFRALYGESDERVGSGLNNMAAVYQRQGDKTKALELYEKVLDIRRRSYSNDHPDVANTLNNIAAVYPEQGDYSKALKLYEEALDIMRRSLGNDHPSVSITLGNIANVYQQQGDCGKALEFYEKSLDIMRRLLGSDHPSIGITLGSMAVAYKRQGDNSKALELYEKALDIKRRSLGNDHVRVAYELYNMGLLFKQQQLSERALECFREAKRIRTISLPPGHPLLQVVNQALASFD